MLDMTYDEIDIDEIVFSACNERLVDIEVENDHTFFVSTTGTDYALTHNTSWPDIDSDAGDRDVLIDAARELFGDDAVIPVSNFNTLKLKSLVKDVAKFFNVPFEEVNAVTGPLQDEVMPHAKDDDQEKSVFVLKHDDCMKYSPAYKDFMEKYPEVEEHVNALFMENRSIGRHAGGVLVAEPKALAEGMPIIGVRGELQTPWTEGMNFRNLEDNGFLKFDFLGLTLLKDVENCIRRILIKQGAKDPSFAQIKDFFDEHLNCRTVLQDDPKVWKHVYHEGRFVGVFQFTADGARKFCLDAKPNNIGELAALTAIYRPGPLKANVHKLYVQAKKDVAKIKYDHPVIQDVLGPTFGYVVFQEQFMMLAQKLAGFSPGEADQLRKTLVKKSLDTLGKKSSEKEAARKQFIDGAKSLHNVPESVTSPLWDTIEAFSVYGFNKSLQHDQDIDTYDKDGNFIRTVNINRVMPGVYVKSRDEKTQHDIFVKVIANHDHGEVPIFKITLDGGEEVRCSMHHKFRTKSGEMMPLWYILQEDLAIVSVGKHAARSNTYPTDSSAPLGWSDTLTALTTSGVRFAENSATA